MLFFVFYATMRPQNLGYVAIYFNLVDGPIATGFID
jgi:hypothetical protein